VHKRHTFDSLVLDVGWQDHGGRPNHITLLRWSSRRPSAASTLLLLLILLLLLYLCSAFLALVLDPSGACSQEGKTTLLLL
jgi:hypothetical protein